MLIGPWIALLCLVAAFGLLVLLSVIDLKTLLLPNRYVFPFGLLALPFHFLTHFHYLSALEMGLGFAGGFGVLYAIRFVANFVMKTDTLGLGDVKLMGAAGLWLGPHSIFIAMSLGAMAGLLHGAAIGAYQIHKKNRPNLARFSIPAGPGFALGIGLTILYAFWEFLEQFWKGSVL